MLSFSAKHSTGNTNGSFGRFFKVAMLVLLTASGAFATTEPPQTTPPSSRKGPLRIVCLGDSITQGYGLVDAEGKQAMNKLGYPAKLGALLGTQAVVKVYGAGGTTYFRKAVHAFEKTAWMAYLKIWQPQVVTLAFGTNCSNDNTWPKLSEQYPADVKWLITEVRRLNPGVEIYLCFPPPTYSDKYGINEKTIQNSVIPALMKIAAEKHLNTIDLHTALSHHPELFFDTIHPNEDGMRLIARTIADRLYETRQDLTPPGAGPPTP
jgi:lysophospholipase L1-like esterase